MKLNLSLSVFLPQVGDLEPMLIPMQMTVKGCPLYFQMTGPRPEDQNQGPIIQSVLFFYLSIIKLHISLQYAFKKKLHTFKQ